MSTETSQQTLGRVGRKTEGGKEEEMEKEGTTNRGAYRQHKRHEAIKRGKALRKGGVKGEVRMDVRARGYGRGKK